MSEKAMSNSFLIALRELALEYGQQGKWLHLDLHFKLENDGITVVIDEARLEEARTTIIDLNQ